MNKKQKKVLARIIIAAVLMIILHFIPVKGNYRVPALHGALSGYRIRYPEKSI